MRYCSTQSDREPSSQAWANLFLVTCGRERMTMMMMIMIMMMTMIMMMMIMMMIISNIHLYRQPVERGLGAGHGEVPDPVHDEGGVAGEAGRAGRQLRQEGQEPEEVDRVLRQLDAQEHHLGHVLGQARVVPGDRDDDDSEEDSDDKDDTNLVSEKMMLQVCRMLMLSLVML